MVWTLTLWAHRCSATVDFPSKSATVTGTASTAALIEAVEAVGFDAAVEAAPSSPVRLSIDGMMCMKNCGTTVQTALRAVAGVQR